MPRKTPLIEGAFGALLAALQWFATEGLASSSDWLRCRAWRRVCSRTLQTVSYRVVKRALEAAAVGPDLSHPRGLVIVAGRAIADVELVADDRKPHRVRAEQELAVFDGVKAEVDGEIRSAAAVPTGAMTDLRFETVGAVHLVCWGT